MNLLQEMQDFPSLFYSKLKSYQLSPKLLQLIDHADHIPQAATASQSLRIYNAYFTFGLTEAVFPNDRKSQNPKVVIRFNLPGDKPNYARLDEVLKCNHEGVRKEIHPNPRVFRDALEFVGRGIIRGYTPEEDRLNQAISLDTLIDFQLRRSNVDSRKRAEALWVVAMRPLLSLARN